MPSKRGHTQLEIANNTLLNFAHGMMIATGSANAATNIFIHDNDFQGPGTRLGFSRMQFPSGWNTRLR